MDPGLYFTSEDDLDRMCVERILRGEVNAFEEILQRYERPVYNAVIRLGMEREEARDACQRIFLRAYERLEQYDRSRRFFSWLYRVAINEALNRMKAHKSWDPLPARLPDRRPSVEEQIIAAEEERELHQALQRLDIKYRLAIIARHFLQLSYEEAAEVLSIPVKTVKSRLFEGRQRLRAILEERSHAHG